MAARPIKRLTARSVATLSVPGRHSDGQGLYVVVSATGARKWVFLYRWKANPAASGAGRLREMGLGSVHQVSLAAAREKAAHAREALGNKLDPLVIRRVAASVPTFAIAADELIGRKAQELRSDKSVARWKLALEGYAASLRPIRVDAVETADVLKVLSPIWSTKPEMAQKTRGYIEAVLDAAKAQGHRSGENPARWKGHLDHLLAKRVQLSRGHHVALPYEDLPHFMTALRKRDGEAARALEFLILTAARSGEVRGATWSEVDLDEKLWVVPAERMKSALEHRVPLTSGAIDVLENARTRSGLGAIFPSNRGGPLSATAMQLLLKSMKVDVNPHGFRATFRTWAAEMTSFPREIAEAALAHSIGDQTERAYARGDLLMRRRELMSAWANFATQHLTTN